MSLDTVYASSFILVITAALTALMSGMPLAVILRFVIVVSLDAIHTSGFAVVGLVATLAALMRGVMLAVVL